MSDELRACPIEECTFGPTTATQGCPLRKPDQRFERLLKAAKEIEGDGRMFNCETAYYKHSLRIAELEAEVERMREREQLLEQANRNANKAIEDISNELGGIIEQQKERIAELEAEVKKLTIQRDIACHYASLQPDMIIPGGATRAELEAVVKGLRIQLSNCEIMYAQLKAQLADEREKAQLAEKHLAECNDGGRGMYLHEKLCAALRGIKERDALLETEREKAQQVVCERDVLKNDKAMLVQQHNALMDELHDARDEVERLKKEVEQKTAELRTEHQMHLDLIEHSGKQFAELRHLRAQQLSEEDQKRLLEIADHIQDAWMVGEGGNQDAAFLRRIAGDDE